MLWILDAGHGIETPGKRSPKIPPGIREYEFNRDIVRRISQALEWLGIPTHIICQDDHTMSLSDRKRIARVMISEWEGNAAFVSVHANASGRGGWNENARGVTVFTRKDPKKMTDRLANLMCERIASHSKLKYRGVKHKNFTMVTGLPCPSVLTENGFMTSKQDCEILASDSGRRNIAEGHVNAILRFQEIS